MFIKDKHYSIDLENAIIGSFLIDNTSFGRCYEILIKDVFYTDNNQFVFETIERMWQNNEPIDLITVCLKISKVKTTLDDASIAFYLTKLTNSVVSTANLEYHSLLLRQFYVEREIIKITNSGIGEDDAFVKIRTIQDKLLKLTQINSVDDFKGIDEVLVSLYEHMDNVKDKELAGVTTGFKHLDRITGGLTPGGVFIVAARPSVGKSAFLGKMVLGAALKGHHCGIISLEMQDEQISARLASLTTEIDFWKIYRNRMQDQDEANRFYKILNDNLSQLPIYISDTSQVNISDIKAKVSKLKQQGKMDVLYIDYLGLIEAESGNKNYNREQEVAKMSRGLKLIAMQFNIPIVLLCQLNRGSETTGDKRPKLFNLRESGSIEQDADGVLFIHRDFMSGILVDANGNTTENEADIIIAKWRNGELTDYKIGFDGPKMKFYEFEQNGFIPVDNRLQKEDDIF